MSKAEPPHPSESTPPDDVNAAAPGRQRPDWLIGAEEGAMPIARDDRPSPEANRGATGLSGKRAKPAPEGLVLRKPQDEPPAPTTGGDAQLPEAPEAPIAAGDDAPPAAPAAWGPTVSSVPKLSQAPVAGNAADIDEPFPGFAQDAIDTREWATSGPAGGKPHGTLPRGASGSPIGDDDLAVGAQDAPFAVLGLPPRVVLSVAGVVVAAVVTGSIITGFVGRAITERGASLAQIRQHPEAFQGRKVMIAGEAGRVFRLADRYIFDLYQGRDTIVVCSPSRRPGLHESVKVGGTVSVGYVNGEPRLALLEVATQP